MTFFLLFSQQRSGTGALASFIVSHPQVKSVAEVLNPFDFDHEDNFFNYWLKNDPVAAIRAHKSPSDLFMSYLDDLHDKYHDVHVLIDVKLNSIRHVLNYWEELPGFTEAGMPWVMFLLQSRQYHAIYLDRQNHLHRFISSKLAEVTGVYRTSDPRTAGQAKLEVDVGEMMEFIFKSETSHATFMPMFEKFDHRLYLTYAETFLASKVRLEVKVEIARFFGFPLLVENEPYYVKLRATKLEKVVRNFRDVASELERAGRGLYLEQ